MMEYGPKYGARILDRYMPNWYLKIEVHMLDMWRSDYCIAGQLFKGRTRWSGHDWFLGRMPAQDSSQDLRFGFDSYSSRQSWVDLINERLTQV